MVTGKNAHKNSHTFQLPKGTHFILTDMAGFLAYDLPAGPEKERLLRSINSQWQLLFSSSITVMAVTTDFHRCFPILLCLHRHHIVNIHFYKSYFTTKKQKCNRKILWFFGKYYFFKVIFKAASAILPRKTAKVDGIISLFINEISQAILYSLSWISLFKSRRLLFCRCLYCVKKNEK